MLPSDTEDAELTETEPDNQESLVPPSTTPSELGDDYVESEEYSDENEDDDWEPPTKTPRAKQPCSVHAIRSADHVPLRGRSLKPSTNQPRVAKLTRYMDNLNINENSGVDHTIILPGRRSHGSLNVDDDDEEEFDPPVVKKKKRSVTIFWVAVRFGFYTNIRTIFIANWGRIPL